MLSDEQLLSFNALGFMPGPQESEEAFIQRIKKVQETFAEGGWIPESHWDWVRLHLKELYDFAPACLPAFYSNESLMPWHGAVSWIEEKRLASVQLREALKDRPYWGYTREEVLSHEAVHAARSAFDEPQSEEFFAFMASEKRWRKIFGPMIQKHWEVWPFIIGVGVGLFFPPIHLAVSLWVLLGGLRLVRLHCRMHKAGKKILQVVKDKRLVRAILFRLTDAEIALFARQGDVLQYANSQKCLRWRLIRLVYL